MKVGADFTTEYPDGEPTATEAYATLCRVGDVLLAELEQRIEATFGVKQVAATALAVIDGAERPLTPSDIGDRILLPSASITSTLDGLERRGWVRRVPNPEDRRSLLIEITPEGRTTADQLLPGIRGPGAKRPVGPHRAGADPAAGHVGQGPRPRRRDRSGTHRAVGRSP